jgi:uncharacterized protein YycO
MQVGLAACIIVAILGGVGCNAVIQRATRSPFNHMGVIFLRDGRPFVLEAHDGVEATPLEVWAARGEDDRYVVKRLRDADSVLKPGTLDRMRTEGRRLFGRPYDSAFGWDDDRLYCSELVWKIFERGAGVRIGEPRPLRDDNLQDSSVVAELRKQFGEAVPLDELMVAPADMFASTLLVSVP